VANPTIDIGTALAIPQAQRGPFTETAPFTQDFGVANNPAITAISFTGNFAAASLADPTKSCQVIVSLVNPDATLQEVFGFTWQGTAGNDPKTGLPYGNPVATLQGGTLASILGKTCRVSVVLPARMGFGGTVAVN
jgi:hypothetical protein